MDMSPQDSHSPKRNNVLDDATLVDQLNTLLSSLNIPITLISPTDLTPSLLVAILESVLGKRIPLIDRNKGSKNSKASKVQNMKIFLGVLELDVLKTDVGLSDVDPRRLADGEWEEIFFVAEILCWMGRRAGIMRRTKAPDDELPVPVIRADIKPNPPVPPLSPKSQLDLDAESLFQTGSTVTGSTRPSRLMFSPFIKDSDGDSVTSLDTEGHQDETQSDGGHPDDVSDILSALPPFTQSAPKCIHEVPSPSLLFSRDFGLGSPSNSSRHEPRHSPPPSHARSFCSDCDPTTASTLPIEHGHSADQSRTSVRYDGFIQLVDEESELASFESSRSMLLDTFSLRQKSQRSIKIEAVKEQYARTQQLLNQRAQLLSQLAELKKAHG